MKNTKVISIANLKGGVGKTTTTVNLAAALIERGFKVLVLDNDPQSNLSAYLLGLNLSDAHPANEKSTLDELYLAKKAPSLFDAQDRFLRTHQYGFDFIGADKNLAGVEYFLYSKADRESILKKNLAWTKSEYDYVLIDNPPSLNLLTLNSFVASDGILVPVQAEYFSVDGIGKINECLEMVRERWNPRISLLGILPTLVDSRKKLTTDVLQLLSSRFPAELMKTKIRDNAKIAESSGKKQTILQYAPSSKGAEDYRSLAEELISTIKI